MFYADDATSASIYAMQDLSERTSPYRNNEGMPVMTLMIEKETPKFYDRAMSVTTLVWVLKQGASTPNTHLQ